MPVSARKGYARSLRRKYLLEHPRCEVDGPNCWVKATQVHHRKRRSQGGTDTPENYAAVCVQCHDLIHSNPECAYRNGLLVHSWDEQ